jgi:hypothetical protein
MNWHLENFLIMESVEPGMFFGQIGLVCVECNCPYEAEYEDENEIGYPCPNCGKSNNPD